MQALPGIGPLRARRLIEYRDQVSAIRNHFDVATATGMSLRQVDTLSDRVSWVGETADTRVGPLPFLITLAISAWLLTQALAAASASVQHPVFGAYATGLLLFLGGLLAGIFDTTLRVVNSSDSDASNLRSISLVAGSAGLLTMIGVSVWLLLTAGNTTEMVSHTNTFLVAAAVVMAMMYGPAVVLRFLTSQDRTLSIVKAQTAYDLGYPLFLLPAALLLWQGDTHTAIEEIFTVWTGILALVAAVDLIKLRSPFMESLSDLDQGRFRFMKRYLEEPAERRRLSRPVGVTVMAGVLMLGIWLLS